MSPLTQTFDHYSQQKRQQQWKHLAILAILLLTLLLSIHSIIIEDTDWQRIGTLEQVLASIGRFAALDFSLIPHLGVPMLETFMMACLGTLLGLFFSLPVAWFGALNVTPSRRLLYPFSRFLMTLSRSIHEMVWALIFVAAVGLGALPGILAIAMRSVGFISKIIAEAIENIDPKPVEAIRAMGGNNFQVMYYGIIPQIKTLVIGTIIFEWDINIRRSAIMGLVGAGGLGLTFFRQMAMYNYGGVTVVILAILTLILLGEIASHYVRKAIN
ncbi:MAG: phosphonate ABC transporter, permease protein PhnE [Marinobacterium sp.]|nr:phosphonate ABC transporter, permease protein PhnE [Marinobacterium sp.]